LQKRGSFDLVVSALAVLLIDCGISPYLTGFPGISYMVFVPLWFVVAKNIVLFSGTRSAGYLGQGRRPMNSRILLLVLMLVLLLGLQIGRAVIASTISVRQGVDLVLYLITTYLFAVAVYHPRFRTAHPDNVTKALLSGVGIFVMVNLVLHALGVKPPQQLGQAASTGDAVMLSFLGMDIQRVFFPLATSLNSYGVISGVTMVAGFAMFWRSSGGWGARFWWLCMMLAGVVSALLSDTRGAALFAVLAMLAMALPWRLWSKAHWFILASPLAFLAAAGLIVFLSAEGSDLIQGVTRADALPGDVGSGRLLVWASVVDLLYPFEINHLIGYGAYGQVTSGVSRYYEMMFSYLDNPAYATLHNTILQYVVDAGYVGFGLLFYLLFSGTRTHCANDNFRKKGGTGVAVVSVVLFLIMAGWTESVISLYFRDTLFLLVMISAAAGAILRPASLDARKKFHGVRTSHHVPSGQP